MLRVEELGGARRIQNSITKINPVASHRNLQGHNFNAQLFRKLARDSWVYAVSDLGGIHLFG